jgi:glycosyltransferase involved in cell wall biosynthesis
VPDVTAAPAPSGLAVVVCCRDRAALLEEALAAVVAALREGDELVVVDSGSTDPRVQQVARAAGAHLVVCERPGLSRARNAGWQATRHDVVLFTDDDCRPLPGWREAALQVFADASVGAAWGSVEADASTSVPLSSGDVDRVEMHRGTVLSDVGHGASMAFRRPVLEAIGGFDELLGAGAELRAGEDKDAFWRCFTAGWRVVSAPQMGVTHVVHRGAAEALRTMHGYGVGAGAVARKRADELGAAHVLSEELWRNGVLLTLRHLKHGRRALAWATVRRADGFVRGWRRARRLDLADGHLQGPPDGAG